MNQAFKVAFGRHLLVIALYIGVTFFMAWPVVTSISSRVAGQGGDPWQTLWRFEEKASFLADSWHTGQMNTFWQQEFLGGGEARLVNLSVWPWMWLYALAGLPAAYNLIWLLSFVLSGYGMYLFVRKLSLAEGSSGWMREGPAFLAGLYYMFLPYHVAHAAGHFGAMQLQWLPLIAWATLSFFIHRRVKYAVLLGILLPIQAWSEHHYMLWLALFAIVAALWWRRELLASLRDKKTVITLGFLLMWLFVSVVLPYFPTVRLSQDASSTLSLGEEQTIRFSSDIFAFVFPAAFHPIWGRVFGSVFTDNFTGNVAESTQYLGIAAILLLLFFHHGVPRRQLFFWVTIGGIFVLIALGPALHVLGDVKRIPLPYAVIQSLPVFSAVRAVGRAGVMVGFATATLLGWVLTTQLHRRSSLWIAAGILVIDFLFFPVPMQSATLPAVYDLLAQAPGTAVVEIPAATNYMASSRALFASLKHGKEVIGSIALERADDSAVELTKAVPGIRQLLYVRTTELREDRSEFFSQSLPESLSDAFRFFDVGAVIIHADSVSALQLSSIRRFLEEDMHLMPQIVDDAVLYTFDPKNLSVSGDGVFLMRDGRWSAVGYDPKRQSVFAEVESEASFSVVNIGLGPRTVRFSMTVFSDSMGALEVRDARGSVIKTGKPGEQIEWEISLPTGTSVFTMSAMGGKGIIQNPVMSVLR